MTFSPSIQQAAVFTWVKNGNGSARIEAVAGAGKTTTLCHALSLTTGRVATLAFNKKIAEEFSSRITNMGINEDGRIEPGTIHSLGMGVLSRALPRRPKFDDKKLYNLATGKDSSGNQLVNPGCLAFAMRAVSMAKQAGIGATIDAANRDAWYGLVDHYSLDQYLTEENNITLEDALRNACLLLKASNARTDIIDYNDMIYLPVRLQCKAAKFDWVFLDECQDTNAMRLALIQLVSHKNTRLLAVGDSRQAVYGFAGADSDSVATIDRAFNCQLLPLTVTYRCPKAVVAEARQWVDHIEAHESAPDGAVSHCDINSFWDNLFPSIGAETAILCRNTAPIVRLAYSLLAKGKACMVEGRDIGTGLIKLASKWKRVKTIGALRNKLENWHERETAKAEAKDNDSRKQAVADQHACLTVIMAQFADDDSVSRVTDSINKMFGDIPPGAKPIVLTLATIHRSKGREWQRVIWWGRNVYNPSKYARKEWEMLQEDNLMYVAATRAQSELIYVNLDAA